MEILNPIISNFHFCYNNKYEGVLKTLLADYEGGTLYMRNIA